MADKRKVLGTIEQAGGDAPRPLSRREAEPLAASPVASRSSGADARDADFERRRALRLQLEQSYSVHNGVYADPARPTVPLFVAESRKIIAYDTREPTIRAMLDLAQANRWNAIKVTGDREFQRRVWIEAKARGMEATLHSSRLLQRPYQPSADDLKIVARLKEARGVGNRIEPERPLRAEAGARQGSGLASANVRPEAHASSRRKGESAEEREQRHRTAIAAVDAYLATKGISADVRAAIRDLAQQELIDRDAAGRSRRANVVDPTVPGRAAVAPEPSPTVGREPALSR
jgi:hypothetical protein